MHMTIGTEKQAVKALVETLSKRGHMMSVRDGEGVIEKRTNSVSKIVDAVQSVEDCYLQVWDCEGKRRMGSVFIVAGNGPVEQFADWTEGGAVDVAVTETIAKFQGHFTLEVA